MAGMRKSKIGVLGPFGFGNLGDAATQDAMIANIRDRQPGAEIVGISLNPEDTAHRHQIAAFPISPQAFRPEGSRLDDVRREFGFDARAFGMLRRLDLLIVSGGGQLDDAWGGARAHPLNLLRWTLLAQAARVPVAFVSVGAGPIFSSWSKRFLRWALSRAAYRSYRDEESRELIRGIGIRDPGRVFPDLAFSLPLSETRRVPGDRPTVGIGPMPHRDPRMSPQPGPDPRLYREYVRKLADFTGWVIEERNAVVVFYVGEARHDPPVITDVVRQMRDGRDVREGVDFRVPKIDTVSDLMECLAPLDLVVASRFHGVLLPLSLSVPAVAMSYHPKVTVLMDTMGLGEFCFDIDEGEVYQLQEAFDRAMAGRGTIAESLAARSAEHRCALAEQYDLILPA